MINTIEKALSQLHYRISNGRYEPKQVDADAYNFIAEWVNQTKLKALEQNKSSRKLAIMFFLQEIEAKQSWSQAEKKLIEFAKYPLEQIEDNFCVRIEQNNIRNWMINNNCDSINGFDFEELTPELQKEFETIFMHPDRNDKIKAKLKNTISEFLIRF